MVIPSTPGAPLLLRTRFHALCRFSRSHTSSISCSVQAGRSGAGFAASDSALQSPLARGFTPALRLRGPWVLLLLSTHELPVLLATPNRSGLQPFVPGSAYLFAPPFGLRSASISLADVVA